MNALIFGSTGMVGTETLTACLEDSRVTAITSIARKSTGVSHPKLKEIIHSDYLHYSELEAELSSADVCHYCIGVYQNRVPKDRFWEITVDYLQALVTRLQDLNPEITFCLFSAQGADPTERSFMRFAKAKGRAERILFESALKHAYAFRAGYINPVQKPAASGVAYAIFKYIYRLVPAFGIDADKLGRVMVDVGITGNDLRVFENKDLRKYAESLSP